MTQLEQTYLMVSDIGESTEFYRDVVGLEISERSESKTVFETGSCEFVLEEDFDEETLAAFGLSPPTSPRGDGAIVVFGVDVVEAVYERARDYGSTIPTAPREVDWGRKLCLIEDPDGYVLEISRPV